MLDAEADLGAGREAAVLLLLYPGADGAPHVPFILRRDDLRHHRGQIGLPGGGREPADATLLDTARREAWEELAIPPDGYDVVSALDRVYASVSNYTVSTYVAVTDHRPRFVPDPGEVAELLEVPLAVLEDRGNWHEEIWDLPGGAGPRRIYFCRFGHHNIWGLTARIVNSFLEGVNVGARDAFERRIRDRRPSG